MPATHNISTGSKRAISAVTRPVVAPDSDVSDSATVAIGSMGWVQVEVWITDPPG